MAWRKIINSMAYEMAAKITPQIIASAPRGSSKMAVKSEIEHQHQ